MDGVEEEPYESPEPARGGWEAWKDEVSALIRSAAALLSVRWDMATREAGVWGKSMALRAGMFLLAAAFGLLGAALLVAGLVAVLAAWWGTLVGAIFAVFGLCALSAVGLAAAALRSRPAHRFLARTTAEIRRDLEAFSEPEA